MRLFYLLVIVCGLATTAAWIREFQFPLLVTWQVWAWFGTVALLCTALALGTARQERRRKRRERRRNRGGR